MSVWQEHCGQVASATEVPRGSVTVPHHAQLEHLAVMVYVLRPVKRASHSETLFIACVELLDLLLEQIEFFQ